MKPYLKNALKKVISELLTQEPGNKINTSLFKVRNKHKWFFRLIYGTANDEEIFNNLLQKLNGKYDILMIHCSFNNMIPMYTGNLGELLSFIISYCNQNNITLVMPTFFLGSNYQAKEHYENGKNIFDVRKTLSEMGLLSEIFRRTPEVKRSIHPTHSLCALGPLADKLTRNHHLADTTFGEGTPFSEILKYRTMILGIGTGNEVLTQIHSAEDILKDKFPIILYSEIIPVTCLDELGNKLIYNLRIKSPEYIYDRKSFRKILKGINIMEWTHKGIPFFLTQANVVAETFIEAAKNGQTIYKKKTINLNYKN